jgi:hypothetical protein
MRSRVVIGLAKKILFMGCTGSQKHQSQHGNEE